MTIEKITLTTITQEQKTNHLYYKQQSVTNRRLMVILPGRGYTVERPLLHYLKNLALENTYDVLSITYAFQVAQVDGDISTLQDEVALALKALPHDKYTEVIIAGKSLGTLLSPIVANHFEHTPCRRILLTPIHNATAMNEELPTLAIIGTADPYYDTDRIVKDSSNPQILWRYYENLNHSLEDTSSWSRSLEMLNKTIIECERFLQS